MSLICSCCREQKFQFVEINFEIPQREKCEAVGIVCVSCGHTQEIMSIKSLTIEIRPSENDSPDQMRDYIKRASGSRENVKPEAQQATPISQATLRALQKQNINVSYDSDGNPLITAVYPEKPVLQKYVPNVQKALPAEPNPDDSTNP
jgi:hypothetical protein